MKFGTYSRFIAAISKILLNAAALLFVIFMCYQIANAENKCVTSGSHRKIEENCTILAHYEASIDPIFKDRNFYGKRR